MALQRICNGCGQPIDESEKFWTGQITLVGDVPPGQIQAPNQVDFHENHLPTELQPEPK